MRLFAQIRALFRPNTVSLTKDWKKLLLSLFIVQKEEGVCLFSHHFQLGKISRIDTQLVGIGFTALSKMMQETIDSSSQLSFVDLGKKKVLFEERDMFRIILVTQEMNKEEFCIILGKVKTLAEYFEKLFFIQQQITSKTFVCPEDYALTTDLVSLIFDDEPTPILKIIPLIFKSVQKKNFSFSRKAKYSTNFLPEEFFSVRIVKKNI
jgi:hypothetical protein